MAQATVAPTEMVSRPARLQISLHFMIDSSSSLRHRVPKAHAVSYSGRSVCGSGHLPPSALYSAPQPRGQWEQEYFLILYLGSNTGAPILVAFSSPKSTTPMPPQFLTGESPLRAEGVVKDPVPYSEKAATICAIGLFFIAAEIALLLS